MGRRVVGVIVSLVLAAIGTWIIINYVSSADDRALEGQEAVEIYVVTQPIAEGTDGGAIESRVELEKIPVVSAASGAVTDLAQIAGRVASVDLVPGEQVIASRFIAEEDLVPEIVVEIPPELLEVTVLLSPERILGGELLAGDLIAFVASFQPFTLDAVEPEGTENLQDFIIDDPTTEEGTPEPLRTPNTSHIIAHKVLVTNVQFTNPPTAGEEGTVVATPPANVAPGGQLLVTLAVDAPTIERIVFTAEFGTIWLAKEQPTSLEDGTEIQTRGTIYQ